ncbi:O-antigen ligase family protein [Paenibacillus sp. FSL R5-0345]|uniref:O-antigen ligase family protein n=1 Tax=Paenibacillus sp. FSL R5-0345 TaxID=1536770 RepID=UPI00069363D8|nr:O-antigen ligase family protein [Paenibacillus sp. FSL R5-0345]
MWNVNKARSLDSLIIYFSAALVIAAGVGACLLRGFFFTEEMYPFLVLWFVMCSAILLYLYIGVGKWRGSVWGISGVPIVVRIILIVPLLVLSLYLIHWLGEPLSAQGTMNEMLRWGLYASFAFLVCFCALNRVGRQLIIASWFILGMFLSMSALLAVCGVVELPFAVAYSNSSEVSITGARLAGVMEYPNAFGAVMAIFLLERLFAAAAYYVTPQKSAKKRVAGERGIGRECEQTGIEYAGGGLRSNETGSKCVEVEHGSGMKWSKCDTVSINVGDGCVGVEQRETGSTAAALLRLLPLFPYAAALLLSESRGAWLTAACACAAVLLWKRQLIAPLLAAGAAPVVAAALLYRQLARAGLAVEPLPGLLLLAGLWAGALLAGLWLCRRQRSAAGSARAAMLALAAAGWTAAGTAVLLHVRERITGPSSTVSARSLFYRDAWRLAAEAPWLGRGGETWRSSYLAAQSRPYVGSQVHSGYLDILLNLGFVGLAAILLMLLAAGWLLAKSVPRLLPPFLVIVLHSAVDFDWSYGLIWLLLFWLPALALAEYKQEYQSATTRFITKSSLITHSASATLPPAHSPSANLQTMHSTSVNMQTMDSAFANRLNSVYPYFRGLLITVAGSFCLVLFVLSFQAAQGERYYRQAVQTVDSLEKVSLLQQSLAWNPRSSRTAIVLSRLLTGEKSVRILWHSLQYSPENPGLSWEMAGRWMYSDDQVAALYWVRRSLRLDKYNNAKWVKGIEGMLMMGRKKLAEGNRTEAMNCIASGNELLRQYRVLAEFEASKGEQHNDRKFHMTEQADDLSRRLSVLASRF